MPGRWDLLPADLQADVLIRTGTWTTWTVDQPGGLRIRRANHLLRIVPWSLCRAWRECILVRDGGQSLLQFLILEHGPEQTLLRAARCTRPALDPCVLLRKLLEQHELGSPQADCLEGNALVAAAGSGNTAAAQLLLGWREHAPRADCRRGAALVAASRGGHLAAMQLLLRWPEHAPMADCMSGEALVQAAEHGQVAAMRLLLGWPERAPKADYRSGEALVQAAEHGQVEAMQLLLGWGVDAPTADCQYGMALVAAVRGGSEAAARLLLGLEANPARADCQDCRALVQAADAGDEAMVRLLLGQEANPARANCQAGRALAVAAGSGNEAMVRLLLEPREHAPRPDGLEGKALFTATAKGHDGVLRLLLGWMQHSPQSELQNGQALAAAVEARQNTGVLQLLLDWRDHAPPPTDCEDWGVLAAASRMALFKTALFLICHPRFAINSWNGCFTEPRGADAEGGGACNDAYWKLKELLQRMQKQREQQEQQQQQQEQEQQQQQEQPEQQEQEQPEQGQESDDDERSNERKLQSELGGEGLVLAARAGHERAARLFLGPPYRVPAGFHDGAALVAAAGAGSMAVVDLLVRKGNREVVSNLWAERALLVAVRGGHEDVVKQLLNLQWPYEPPQAGCQNGQAFVEAACGGHAAIALHLLNFKYVTFVFGDPPNWPEPELGAALWQSWAVRAAVQVGHEQVEQFLRDLRGLMEAGAGGGQPSPVCMAAVRGGYDHMRQCR